MFGSDILDVAVGLVFVYLLASLIVSAATELFAGWLGWRADKLLDGVRNLLNSAPASVSSPPPSSPPLVRDAEDWAEKLYDHPLIQGLSPLPTKAFAFTIGKRRIGLVPAPTGPSYIPAGVFSTALLGLIQNLQPTIANVAAGLQGILNTATDPQTTAGDIKKRVLQIAGTIPSASPPGAIGTRIKTDLQALADKIPNSDVSLGQLAAGMQTIIGELSDADPNQASLKQSLQNLIGSPPASLGSVDQLKDNLQALINGIAGYSAPILTIKNDLQTLLRSVPSTSDSAAVAVGLLRAFADGVWTRYLADIIDQIPDGKLKTTLSTLLQQSEGDLESLKQAVETWFNAAMDRVSGWYKRHTQWVQLILGVVLTFAINLDSVSIVRALSMDNSGLLKATVAQAQNFIEHSPAGSNQGGSPKSSPTPAAGTSSTANDSNPVETLRLSNAQLSALTIPLGWTAGPAVNNSDFRQWPGWPSELKAWWDTITHHLIGWLLTVVAVSLGAPFWFDLLSRFISIRASGDPPPEPSKPQKDSESNKQS